MKRLFLCCFIGVFGLGNAQGQNIGIGTTTPNASALLDISSTNRGLLPPRMTAVQRNAIASPANGLIVFDTDSAALMLRSAGGWRRLTTTATPGGFWQTNDGHVFNTNPGFVGIGVANPSAKLEVAGNMIVRGGGNPTAPPFIQFFQGNGFFVSSAIGVQNDSMFGVLTNTGWALNINTNNGQVGIGTSTPSRSAMLDISSTNRGLLPPRMTAVQRNAIASPANGLIVFDTDSAALMLRSAGGWRRLTTTATPGGFWQASGTNIFNLNTGNLGIGTNNPLAKLHVVDSSVVFSGLNTNTLTPSIAPPVQGPGIRMLWYPQKAAFRAGFAGFNTWDRDNIGTHSFAGGQATMAKGRSSTAFGLSTEAKGDFSTATGIFTKSKAFGSMVVGAYNDTSDNPIPDFITDFDRIFQIGNGWVEDYRKNAVTVLRNGNVGIGTTTPQARLHVSDSSPVVFEGYKGMPRTSYTPPVQGAGSRMMWYPEKIAFRVGLVEGEGSTYWDGHNIGLVSFASGYCTKANGNFSTALGFYTTASGPYSTGLGFGTTSSGATSIATGFGTIASGNNSTAIGYETTASGDYSIAMGYKTIAKPHNGIAIGTWNDNTDDPDLSVWTGYGPTDRIFQIGNGFAHLRRNAMTILRNGNIGLGNQNNPAGRLHFGNEYTNRLLVLHEMVRNDHNFYGFGINAFSMRYQIAAPYDSHIFFAGNASEATASNELFRITGNGNIGVGQPNPNAPLHFNNALQNRKIVLYETQNNDHQFHGFGINHGVFRYQVPVIDDAHVFYAGSSANTSNELFRIQGNGNLGIGRPNPNAPLHFSNSLQNRKIVLYEAQNNDHQYYGFGINNGVLRYQTDAISTAHVFFAATGSGSSNELFRINGNGNATLAGVLTQNSDITLKKNIEPITNASDLLQQLGGYRYQWKDENADADKQLGLLAQEVQKVLPELVKANEGGKLGVNYSGLIPVLLEALKEQQQEMQQQKALLTSQQLEIQQQKALMTNQQQRLEQLESVIQNMLKKEK